MEVTLLLHLRKIKQTTYMLPTIYQMVFNEIPMKFPPPPTTPEKKALCREVKQIKFTFT